jgi:uncharacterized lipoprotein YddW (UPF0748 family)
MRKSFSHYMVALALISGAQAEPVPEKLAQVGHPRELRGAWVASVANINFPSRKYLGVAQMKQELCFMLDQMEKARFNAIFFQVRPEGDALYSSDLEPWSRFLSGAQGVDPGFDPLEFVVEEAHQRNIEVHAWLNPYRAQAINNKPVVAVAPHIGVEEPGQVKNYASLRWMNPASTWVRERLVNVCQDLTKRYDIDGIHFDDYFYPYPEAEQEFPDAESYADYQRSGGQLSKGDWRRQHVNTAIKEVSEAIHKTKDYVRFGISPFGLPAPQRPTGISGFDQYEKLYADSQLWMDQGWIDYLAPQLYWPTTKTAQAYQPLLEWWCQHRRPGHYIFPGLNLVGLGSQPSWSLEEYRKEFELQRANATQGAQGSICWNVKPLIENRDDVVTDFFQKINPTQAVSPALASSSGRTAVAPRVDQDGQEFRVENQDSAEPKCWVVYRQNEKSWTLDRIVPATQSQIQLAKGQWAISVVTRHGIESPGQIIECR